jgi:hypothetical protein
MQAAPNNTLKILIFQDAENCYFSNSSSLDAATLCARVIAKIKRQRSRSTGFLDLPLVLENVFAEAETHEPMAPLTEVFGCP